MKPEQNLRTVNLNLLPILREVLRHRNLTRAAETLNLTQSAISNSLRQLRDHFGDELLVRDGRNMRLTEMASCLIEPIEEAMIAVQKALAPLHFDPSESDQRFRIATADYVMATFAPPLSVRLKAEGPRMGVQLLTARRHSGEDLRVGRIDMLIMPKKMLHTGLDTNRGLQEEIVVRPLMSEKFMVVGHKDDPDIQKGLTKQRYLERAHAGFFLDFDVHASLEQFYLHESGIRQFERILTSSFTSLPLIAATGSCLTLLPESMARTAAEALPLVAVESPIQLPDIELVMIWHKRREDDAALAWIADALVSCARDVMRQNISPPSTRGIVVTAG